MGTSGPQRSNDAKLRRTATCAHQISGRHPEVLQLTDTHLYANPVGTLLGVNTLDSFQRVIAHFRDHHWPLDLLLATGDLVHDASPEGYALMADILSSFQVPVFCLPGNRDVPQAMREHLRPTASPRPA